MLPPDLAPLPRPLYPKPRPDHPADELRLLIHAPPLRAAAQAPSQRLGLDEDVGAHDEEREVRDDRVAQQRPHRPGRQPLLHRVDGDGHAQPEDVDELEHHRRREAAQAADEAVHGLVADCRGRRTLSLRSAKRTAREKKKRRAAAMHLTARAAARRTSRRWRWPCRTSSAPARWCSRAASGCPGTAAGPSRSRE